MKNLHFHLLTAGLLAGATSVAQAAPTVCVFDILGAGGDIYNLAKDYAIAAPRLGSAVQLRSYTNEKVAIDDLLAGQCDAVLATGLRTRQFNDIAGAIDSLGVSTIVRNNGIDMKASYDVVHKAIQTFASPAGAPLMSKGQYEIAGIVPFGTAYPIVNDRKINTVEACAGIKIAAFDYDKAQAEMIRKIGAQPVSADIANFAAKFNNGSVDMISAPAMAYKPMELYRGIGTKGAVNRFPILILTYQMVLNKSKFPDGFAQKSREYWLGQFDRARGMIDRAEKTIPANAWQDLTAENSVKYTLMFRDARIDIANKGIYSKAGLKIMKRIRCSVNASDSECSAPSESQWN